MADALAAGARFIDISEPVRGVAGRAGRVMALCRELSPGSLVFWNMDAATKMLVAKSMAGGSVRLVDVSPGPMLFRELDRAAAFGGALGMTPDRYLASLDLFVAKYRGGAPQAGPKAVAVIPNGVPDAAYDLAPGDGPAPPCGADPALAVVTVGRLAPAKRPDLLKLVAHALQREMPGATLTVVGAVHAGADDAAWRDMLGGDVMPANLFFAGPDHRTTGFLGRFACFYMVSSGQGCPNASLEAMAAGLPVVANPDGGTAEQVVHGVTGWLVPDGQDRCAHASALARALANVLADPARARAMGEAGRMRARREFSMDAMADAYTKALGLNQGT
jgi:glycosyltransferase involved in cell wall biosynthesis